MCIYTNVYIYIYIYIYTYTYAHVYIRNIILERRLQVHADEIRGAEAVGQVALCIYIYIYIHTCVCVYVCMYVYILYNMIYYFII